MDRNYRFQIDHSCPQCGAPVSLDEAQRLFQCKYCRVRLYITTNGYFHYYLPTKRSFPARDLIFVPYWRFKGMFFQFKRMKTTGRIIDITTLALNTDFFPLSLGIRPQAVRLRYINDKIIDNRFFRYRQFNIVFNQMEQTIEKASSISLKGYGGIQEGRSLCKAFIGERKSLIYLPLYEKGGVFYDAVIEEPLCSIPEGTILPDDGLPDRWETEFIPTLCPSCGWDMEGSPESLVLICRNCGSLWKTVDNALQEIRYKIIKPLKDSKNILLPFWIIHGNVHGVKLQTYGDLIRFANLPRIVDKNLQEKPCAFWIPAFKIQPMHFLRTSLTATVNQKDTFEAEEIPRSTIHPVTLPEEEALEMVKIVVMELSKPRKKIYGLIPELKLRDESIVLGLVPFYDSGFELIQPEMHISINKRMLYYGMNL